MKLLAPKPKPVKDLVHTGNPTEGGKPGSNGEGS
jgi:hypothetical protein